MFAFILLSDGNATYSATRPPDFRRAPVKGAAGPVAIHGVQHIAHQPIHLKSWSKGPRESRLVFIVSGLSEAAVQDSFQVFLRVASSARNETPGAFRPSGAGGIIGGRPVRRRLAPAWLKG
jgi:hypothetical protein